MIGRQNNKSWAVEVSLYLRYYPDWLIAKVDDRTPKLQQRHHVVQPRPFNCLCDSIYLNGLEGRGQPHPQQHHPVPQGPPFSKQVLTGHRKSTDKTTGSARPKCTQLLHGHTRAHLISCVGRATPPPHHDNHFTPLIPSAVKSATPTHTPADVNGQVGVKCMVAVYKHTRDTLGV